MREQLTEKANRVHLINPYRFGGGGGGDGIKRNNIFTSYTSGSQTVSASTERALFEAHNAVDGVSGSTSGEDNWISDSGTLPEWWKIDFGSSQYIHTIRIIGRDKSDDELVDFEIQSSDDDSTWTTRLTVTGHVSAGNSTFVEYDLTSPVSARYWRIYITDSVSGTRVGIVEIEWLS